MRTTTREDELFALVRARLAVPRARARRLRRSRAPWSPTASRRGAAAAARSCIATKSTRRVRGRRGARMLAITSGGAIPEVADYRVVLEPEDTFIGTLNEDFAIESNAGDIFQLGNASWRITAGRQPARCASPTRRARRRRSRSGSARRRRAATSCRARSASLRADIEAWLLDRSSRRRRPRPARAGSTWHRLCRRSGVVDRHAGATRRSSTTSPRRARALGALPTQDTLVLERFFDESGGMQLVLHAPFGSRINKAWGLALRKRFCRQFNFELQAAATEDALLLSLGPQHSFPLADVFRYLHPATAATCWCRRCSTRRSSRRAGAGTRPSRSPCRAIAAAGRCRRSCSACRPTI